MAIGEPFVLDGGGDLAALVVHGFTGTPFEVRYLGEQLAQAGITARGPLLPGHGTSLADLERTPWRAWADAVEAELDALRARYARVALVGQSLGGLLVLELASRRPDVAAVCTLAAPLWLGGLATRAARWTRPGGPLAFVSRLPKLGGSDLADPEAKRTNPSYRAIPTRGLAQLVDFMGVAEAALPRIAAPVLVLHAAHDHTAPVACASRIAARVPRPELVILPRSYHLIATDVERDLVASRVIDFLHRHTAS